MKNSSGFFGRLGNPVTRALPSLLVPTSTCVLRLLKNPYLIGRLTLASKMGLPALSFTMKSARQEPRPASTTGTSGESPAEAPPNGIRTRIAHRKRMGRTCQKRILDRFPPLQNLRQSKFGCNSLVLAVFALRTGFPLRKEGGGQSSQKRGTIPWGVRILVGITLFSEHRRSSAYNLFSLRKGKERPAAHDHRTGTLDSFRKLRAPGRRSESGAGRRRHGAPRRRDGRSLCAEYHDWTVGRGIAAESPSRCYPRLPLDDRKPRRVHSCFCGSRRELDLRAPGSVRASSSHFTAH